MLATFVIGLREGLECALIVSIVAAFLQRQGRPQALRSLWMGVGLAVALCIALAVGLDVMEQKLPSAQQAAFSAAVSAFAVCTVTYMILWMARNARGIKRDLEHRTAQALTSSSARPLVIVAFLAVLREGFETVVFVLATLENSVEPLAGGVGAIIGLLVAFGICYGIYRGGVSINLGKFFQVTGLVLVLVAGGLVASVIHSLAAAGVAALPQQAALDLRWLVQAGSIQGALLSGLFGIRAQPTVAEVAGWLLYVVPVSLVLLLPGRARPASRSTTARAAV